MMNFEWNVLYDVCGLICASVVLLCVLFYAVIYRWQQHIVIDPNDEAYDPNDNYDPDDDHDPTDVYMF